MALLKVDNLRTTFRTLDGTLTAVDDVSFFVEEGETLGIVGESGSGKSVTALSIMGLLSSARVQGTIAFNGRNLLDLRDNEMRRIRGSQVAMIFQDPMTSLNPVLPVGRQLTEVLRLHKNASKTEATEQAGDLLEKVGIPEARRRLRDYPHQFSGGMCQRVMIAMALACDPALVLADEITTALDVTIQAQVLDLLRRLAADRNTAFVMITHDLGIVAGIADRVMVMYAGQIVEIATTADLFAHARMPYTWGLLESLPRMDRDRSLALVPIMGTPPDLADPPPGCRFADRCRYARAICQTRAPELRPAPGTAPGHQVRCWATQDQPEGGWLVGVRDPSREEA